MHEELITALALSLTTGLGDKTLNRLATLCQERGECLCALTEKGIEDLQDNWDLGPKRAELVKGVDPAPAEGLLSHLSNQGCSLKWIGDDSYPHRLHDRLGDDAPFVLYMAGDSVPISAKTVAISGSRECSNEGQEAARAWAESLAREGWVVITGLARGVDQAATRAAFEYGGRVIGVMAEGILSDRARQWVQNAPSSGWSMMSEHPTIPWNSGAAMWRNRLIAAMADAVIVIEPRPSGGTLHQGREAIRQGVSLGVVDLPAQGNATLLRAGGVSIPPAPDLDALSALLTSSRDS